MTYLRKRMIEDLQLHGLGALLSRGISARCGCWRSITKNPQIGSPKTNSAIISSTSKTLRSGPGAPVRSLYAASVLKIQSNGTMAHSPFHSGRKARKIPRDSKHRRGAPRPRQCGCAAIPRILVSTIYSCGLRLREENSSSDSRH